MAGLQDIFLAGIGALSITNEKAKETIDKLIEQGQISLEQGKAFSDELQHKAEAAAKDAAATATETAKDVSSLAGDAARAATARAAGFVSPIEELSIEARMKAMSPEDRAAFVERIQKIATDIDASAAEVAEAEVCDDAEAAADADKSAE